MDKRGKVIPFGLLFEEVAPQPQGLIMSTYDEETDLSYMEDSQDHRIPLVEISGAVGTQTMTAAAEEKTDTDPGDDYVGSVPNREYYAAGRFLAGTETFTKQEKETTDRD